MLPVWSNIIKGVVKVGSKVGGVAIQAIKKGIAKRKEKKAAKKAVDPLTTNAQELVEGTSKYYRDLINKQKEKMRDIDEKTRVVKRLIANGLSESEARAQVGLKAADLDMPVENFLDAAGEAEPEPVQKAVTAGKGCMVTTFILLASASGLIGILIYFITIVI